MTQSSIIRLLKYYVQAEKNEEEENQYSHIIAIATEENWINKNHLSRRLLLSFKRRTKTLMEMKLHKK